jgi:hypothetical protein
LLFIQAFGHRGAPVPALDKLGPQLQCLEIILLRHHRVRLKLLGLPAVHDHVRLGGRLVLRLLALNGPEIHLALILDAQQTLDINTVLAFLF